MKDIEILESIKNAETAAESRVAAAKRESARIMETAKAEIPKIHARAIKEAEVYRENAVAAADEEAKEGRRQVVGEWTSKAKKLKMPDGEDMMQIFKKALKERFGV